MRLIDADELKKTLGITSEDCNKCGWGSYESCGRGYDFEDACVAIDNAVPVDAVPVRHGRWIVHHEKVVLLNGEAVGGVYCSECGYKTHNKMHVILGCPFKYCPSCGALMDGEEHE